MGAASAFNQGPQFADNRRWVAFLGSGGQVKAAEPGAFLIPAFTEDGIYQKFQRGFQLFDLRREAEDLGPMGQ